MWLHTAFQEAKEGCESSTRLSSVLVTCNGRPWSGRGLKWRDCRWFLVNRLPCHGSSFLLRIQLQAGTIACQCAVTSNATRILLACQAVTATQLAAAASTKLTPSGMLAICFSETEMNSAWVPASHGAALQSSRLDSFSVGRNLCT